jgi:uncharacterized membrane protein YhaH (DUF805 family)
MTKYFSFYGRSARSEYWGVLVILIVVSFLLGAIGGIFMALGEPSSILVGILMVLLTGAIALWITLATGSRRCRDIGISPWWTLATIIPYIGFIPLIVFGCIATDPEV